MAKYVATEMVGRVADRAIQVFGGNGYMTEMGVERWARFVGHAPVRGHQRDPEDEHRPDARSRRAGPGPRRRRRTGSHAAGSGHANLRARSTLLLAAAAWTIWVWATRIWNIVGDPAHDAAFKAVHSLLALVSIGRGGPGRGRPAHAP